jgi:hypothetical protein
LQVMFSKPLPDFSCRLNAFATAVTCQWLMGPCKVNDVELDDGRVSACGRPALVATVLWVSACCCGRPALVAAILWVSARCYDMCPLGFSVILGQLCCEPQLSGRTHAWCWGRSFWLAPVMPVMRMLPVSLVCTYWEPTAAAPLLCCCWCLCGP